jgi:ssDNA-binding Zn-finger/Zn-ribbon topoisomerase 1
MFEVDQELLKQVVGDDEFCPECGSKLVERTSSKTGSKFMGCSSYPKCHYIKRYYTHGNERPYERDFYHNRGGGGCGYESTMYQNEVYGGLW